MATTNAMAMDPSSTASMMARFKSPVRRGVPFFWLGVGDIVGGSLSREVVVVASLLVLEAELVGDVLVFAVVVAVVVAVVSAEVVGGVEAAEDAAKVGTEPG